MTTFRPAHGISISEAMEQTFELDSFDELVDHLAAKYPSMNVTRENVKITEYVYDFRVDWDTYLVTIDGQAVLFSKGPVPGSNPT